MPSELTTSQHVSQLIERVRQGDATAREQLLAGVYERLLRLARKMLHNGSNAVRRWEQTDDLLHRAWFRLQRALDNPQVPIHDSAHFFRLAAHSLRFELIDLYRQHTGANGLAANHNSVLHQQGVRNEEGIETAKHLDHCHPADTTGDPQHVAQWAEFHTAVERLPEAEREVFDLIWYNSLKQEEAAEILNVDVRTVKRRWRSARLLLIEQLDGELPPP